MQASLQRAFLSNHRRSWRKDLSLKLGPSFYPPVEWHYIYLIRWNIVKYCEKPRLLFLKNIFFTKVLIKLLSVCKAAGIFYEFEMQLSLKYICVRSIEDFTRTR